MREVGRGLADAREVTRRLQAVRDAENAYAEALSRQKRIQELLSSTRYLLQATDWRVLRGIPFEKFLADVFEFLGYRVETTKASGDQGIDLIVTGKGRRIAIQAKGYEGSVGNGSVQEAYTGAKFYDCPDCVVITNSRFTSGAAEVARRVECKLIDGDRIPDLIDGHIL
jgi:HJR/Mrr/RecB family endonuclease